MAYWRHKLFHLIGMPLMCLAIFSIAGGHWAILQAVAWARMLEEYSRGASIEVAIMKTFGGKYPCGLCRKIEEGSQKQESPPGIKVEKKSESFLCAENSVAEALFPRDFSYPLSVYVAVISPRAAPLLPPPKLVCC
ncbi:MAG TPA: hypothetical protein VIS99_00030 [Terrimicrobiaceae bacterium]